jgi:anti-anti-sigma factor
MIQYGKAEANISSAPHSRVSVEERMDMHISTVGEISVANVNGNVLQENVQVFKNALLNLVNEGKVKIVLDLWSSVYISSLCLAAIVDIKIRANELGGDLKLARINKLACSLLEVTNLVRKIEVFPDVDSAMKSFGPAPSYQGGPVS